jgi:hypothetical protein
MYPPMLPKAFPVKEKKYNKYSEVLRNRNVFPDPDFYPSRIPDATTALKEEGENFMS